ncbi:hypothetical protein PARPLA_00993 [Rhodobacteraceae bacterium THAF1]|nr:hypothetical protein FIU81_02440 [Palleronia sp. THAF1]VDC20492.1 hypothetical protein PARPLA_00993 [Rhodobacteraceae bacterium THAF1]
MPVEWLDRTQEAPAQSGAFSHQGGHPYARLRLWPNRSLPVAGFAGIMAFCALMFLVPLLPLIGTPVFWGLLPFLLAALAALYLFIMRNYRDGQLVEELTIWSDLLSLERTNPRGPVQTWQGNPHWTRMRLHDKPIENYITLSGSGRDVELGAFLSPEEREALFDDLDRLLKRLPA